MNIQVFEYSCQYYYERWAQEEDQAVSIYDDKCR